MAVPPAASGGKSTGQRMIDSLRDFISLQDTASGSLNSRAIDNNKYFQQNALNSEFFTRVYGDANTFMANYNSFAEEYYATLDNKANHAKGVKVNAQLMRKSGKIDLSLLNADLADELYDTYSRKVLKLDALIREGGLPGVEMPSANLYKSSHRFLTLSSPDEVMHPAQIVLNRSFFSFNPRKQGLDSLTVGRSNLISGQVLEGLVTQSESQSMFPGFTGGLKVGTLDLETTGVFEGAEARSLSLAVSDFENGGLRNTEMVKNLFFDSPQLRNVRVSKLSGGSSPMAQALAEAEGRTAAKPMTSFLDESTAFIEELLNLDRVTGHNAYFDLFKMTETMMGQADFDMHDNAKTALRNLWEKVHGGNYLVDTLDSTRSYLHQKAVAHVGDYAMGDPLRMSDAYRSKIFAPEILARVTTGGSAAPFSMENISMNTNLFELMIRDGKMSELEELLQQGSHVAGVDVKMQTFMANYVETKELDFLNVSDRSTAGRLLRSRVLKSQATTPTTNIADVEHLSQTALRYLLDDTPETGGIFNVSVNVDDAGSIFRGQADLVGKSGTLSRVNGAFSLITQDGPIQIANQSVAVQHIQRILQKATQPATDTVDIQDASGISRTITYNKAGLDLVDTGISYGAVSRQMQLTDVIGRQTVSPITDITDDAITKAFGSVYENYGSGISLRDQVSSSLNVGSPRDSVFQVGLGEFADNAPADVASRFAAIGDPFYFMDAESRSISTVLAEATARTGKMLNTTVTARAGVDSAGIAFSAFTDLTAEQGISYFSLQDKASFFRAASREFGTSRVVAPTQLVREAFTNYADDTFRNLSLSVATPKGKDPQVNLVWNIKEQMNKTEAEDMITKIFDFMQDENEVARVLGVEVKDLDSSIRAEVAYARTQGSLGQQSRTAAISNALEAAWENGIVIGKVENAQESAKIIENFGKMGVDLRNDEMSRYLRAAALRTGLDSDGVVLGPLVYQDSLKIAGAQDLLKNATEVVDDGAGGRVSKAVLSANTVANRLGADKNLLNTVRKNVKAGKLLSGDNLMTEFYRMNKKKLGIGAIVGAAAGFGYYKAKQHREKQLYEETIEQMPYENARPEDPLAEFKEGYSFAPQRMRPLDTAGVVGNLDRNKIGHHQMGPNKYDHLFGR